MYGEATAPCPLGSVTDVIRCLETFTDWWQPRSTSLLQIARARALSDGLDPRLVETLELRAELSRRMSRLEDPDRALLFLWYVRQLPVREIGPALGISARQCFRRRVRALRAIVELGNPGRAA